MAARAPIAQREANSAGLLVRALRAMVRLISVLILALVFSVLLEWIGMIAWWPEEGVRHSERMLAQELRFLDEDFKQGFVHARPAELARGIAARVRDIGDAAGLQRLIRLLEQPHDAQAGWLGTIHDLFEGGHRYLEAMLNVMQTFAVRLAVLALATPVFVLFGLVGLAEGLMRRDLRRWGGGRESSFVYHHSKKLLAPAVLSAWLLYLAAPFSVHPNHVLLPFALAFGVGTVVTSATFKKYL